jgi:hypothetical protein
LKVPTVSCGKGFEKHMDVEHEFESQEKIFPRNFLRVIYILQKVKSILLLKPLGTFSLHFTL